jgi:hypothetical protein
LISAAIDQQAAIGMDIAVASDLNRVLSVGQGQDAAVAGLGGRCLL